MKIVADGAMSRLIPETPEDTKPYQDLCAQYAWLEPNRFAMQAYRSHHWDGYRRAINPKSGAFLSGLTEEFVRHLERDGVTLTSVDRPSAPHVALAPFTRQQTLVFDDPSWSVYDHQYRMVEGILKNGGRGIAEATTGAGKTEAISILAKMLLSVYEAGTVWFIVHRVGLVNQTARRFRAAVPEFAHLVGQFGDGKRPKATDRIVFSTLASLAPALGTRETKLAKGNAARAKTGGMQLKSRTDDLVMQLWGNSIQVIIDECHRASGPEYVQIISALAGKVPVCGFSGTPDTEDPVSDWNMRGLLGHTVARIARRELEDKGIIAKAVAACRIFPAPPGTPKKVKGGLKWSPNFKQTPVLDCVWVDEEGNTKPGVYVHEENDTDDRALFPAFARDGVLMLDSRIDDLMDFVSGCLGIGRRTMVMCERVPQVFYLYGRMKDKFRVRYLHGGHTEKERQAVLALYERGEIDVLIVSTIFDEGIDAKNVGAVALAGGGSAIAGQTQRIGRGVRKKADNWVPVWVPLDCLNKFTEDHSNTRLENLEKHEVTCCHCGEAGSEDTRPWKDVLESFRVRYSTVA